MFSRSASKERTPKKEVFARPEITPQPEVFVQPKFNVSIDHEPEKGVDSSHPETFDDKNDLTVEQQEPKALYRQVESYVGFANLPNQVKKNGRKKK